MKPSLSLFAPGPPLPLVPQETSFMFAIMYICKNMKQDGIPIQ